MSIVVDVVILIIIAITTMLGFKRGLSLSLIRIASFIITIILVVLLTNPVANFVKSETDLDDNLKKSLYNMFLLRNENEAREEIREEKAKETKTPLEKYSLKVTTEIKENIEKRQEEMAEKASESTKNMIIMFGVAAIIFIVFRIIFLVVGAFVGAVTDLPVLYQVDKAGGIVYGLLEGIFITLIILTIVYLINIPLTDNSVTQAVEHSILGGLLYDRNPITLIFFK